MYASVYSTRAILSLSLRRWHTARCTLAMYTFLERRRVCTFKGTREINGLESRVETFDTGYTYLNVYIYEYIERGMPSSEHRAPR